MISLANIDMLIQAGLGSVKKLAYYRIILSDPEQAIKSMVYRDLTVKIFGRLVTYVLTDSILFNRMRQLLLQDKKFHEELEVAGLLQDDVELDPAKREYGTASLANLYRRSTPGQCVATHTLRTVKKVVKK